MPMSIVIVCVRLHAHRNTHLGTEKCARTCTHSSLSWWKGVCVSERAHVVQRRVMDALMRTLYMCNDSSFFVFVKRNRRRRRLCR